FRSRWTLGGQAPLSPTPANEVARCEPLTTERNAPQVEGTSTVTSVDEVLRSRQEGCPFPPRPDGTNMDSLLGSKQGDPWVRGTYRGPMGFSGKGDVVYDKEVRCPSPTVRPKDRSRLT